MYLLIYSHLKPAPVSQNRQQYNAIGYVYIATNAGQIALISLLYDTHI